ncbi:MAG: hypothetical protein KBC84_05045 [Proteobacteria bacterium]|nr:hypothetical protein [Pseudomonadota bacterium]
MLQPPVKQAESPNLPPPPPAAEKLPPAVQTGRDYAGELEKVVEKSKLSEDVKEHVDNLLDALKKGKNKLTEEEKSYVHILYASIMMSKDKLEIPAELFKICLDLDDSETGKTKLLFTFARNKNIPVTGEHGKVIVEAIKNVPTDPFYFLISQRADLKIPNFQFPDNYELLSNQFLQEKTSLFMRQVAVFVLAHRNDIDLPKTVLEDLSKMRELVYKEKRSAITEKYTNDKTQKITEEELNRKIEIELTGDVELFAFEKVVLNLLRNHEIPGATEYIRSNHGIGNTLRAFALDSVSSSKKLVSEYSVGKIIQDRGYPGLGQLDNEMENKVVQMAPKGNHVLKSDESYMIWERECFRGNDHRLAHLLALKVSTLKDNTLTEGQLRQIAFPLQNYLSELRNFNPKRFDELAANKPEVIETAAIKLAEKVWQERVSLIEGKAGVDKIFAPGVKLLSLISPDFNQDSVVEIGNRFQMEMGKDKESLIMGSNEEDKAIAIASSFKRKLKANAEKAEQRVVMMRGHGGPGRFWLGMGRTSEDNKDFLDSGFNITAEEFAECRMENLDSKRTDIEIYDACFQTDMVEKIVAEQNLLAVEQGVEIKSFPLTIAASQRGIVSFAETNFPKSSILLAEIPKIRTTEENVFSIKDLMKLEDKTSTQTSKHFASMSEGLSDVLLGVSWASEFSIFSTRAVKNEELFNEAIEALGGEEYLKTEEEEIYDPKYVRPIQVSQIFEVGDREIKIT